MAGIGHFRVIGECRHILCIVLPRNYRSSTLIVVEDQKIPENYVKGIVGSNVEERLTMIQQQVMSRTLLSRSLKNSNSIRARPEKKVSRP